MRCPHGFYLIHRFLRSVVVSNPPVCHSRCRRRRRCRHVGEMCWGDAGNHSLGRGRIYVTCDTEGFSHFVTSMTAPVASGWSDWSGVGLHPRESTAFPRRTREADCRSRHCKPGWVITRRAAARNGTLRAPMRRMLGEKQSSSIRLLTNHTALLRTHTLPRTQTRPPHVLWRSRPILARI
jgi:hypothetical protein